MAGIPFPGAERPQFATPIRVAIGEVISRGGKTFPSRSDHFRITRPSAEDGSKWVLDSALQAALASAAGSDKPTRVPVQLLSNDPADFLHQERNLTISKSGVCVCHSSGFRLKTEEECRKEGLAYPPPDPDRVGEDYYVGTAEWRSYKQEPIPGGNGAVRYIRTGAAPRVCDPSHCPFASGNLEHFKGDSQAGAYAQMLKGKPEAARRICKLRTILVFKLDLPETSRAGALARFTSTGVYSALYLRSSLQAVALETGNWLACLPLWLVLEWTQQKDTPGGRQRLPYVRFESRVATAQLQAQASEISGYLVGNQDRMLRLQAASAGAVRDAVDHDRATPEYVEEFSPAAAEIPVVTAPPPEPTIIDVEPEPEDEPLPETGVAEPDPASITEEEYRALIAEATAGVWSPAYLKGQYTRCSSPEDYAALLKRAREAAAQGPQEPPGEGLF